MLTTVTVSDCSCRRLSNPCWLRSRRWFHSTRRLRSRDHCRHRGHRRRRRSRRRHIRSYRRGRLRSSRRGKWRRPPGQHPAMRRRLAEQVQTWRKEQQTSSWKFSERKTKQMEEQGDVLCPKRLIPPAAQDGLSPVAGGGRPRSGMVVGVCRDRCHGDCTGGKTVQGTGSRFQSRSLRSGQRGCGDTAPAGLCRRDPTGVGGGRGRIGFGLAAGGGCLRPGGFRAAAGRSR
ncbi:MAG: hypothetical protein RLZZ436_118 [Planctomycetota bacterium]